MGGWRRRIMLVAASTLVAVALGGCEEEADEGPKKPSTPIPTTPPHRRPMDPREIARLEALVARQVAAHQADLKKACWEPVASDAGSAVAPDGGVDREALKKAATGGGATLQFHVVYGEEGKEISRQFIGDPTKHVPGLTQCLDKELPATAIPAQNRKVQIRVPMKLP